VAHLFTPWLEALYVPVRARVTKTKQQEARLTKRLAISPVVVCLLSHFSVMYMTCHDTAGLLRSVDNAVLR
jgi:hypothetical protein